MQLHRPSVEVRGRAGFSVVEVAVVLVILVVGLGAMSTTLAAVARLGPVNRETSRALDAARGLHERLRGVPFDEVFATFNEDPDDDPGGAGTAPGASFVVPGLQARPSDADGMPGMVLFPTIGGDLREDFVDDRLGMPRDLNDDGVVDSFSHNGDYRILPVCVRIEWSGRTGDRMVEIHSSLVRP